MAALPSSGISISLVKNTIGSGSTTVGNLVPSAQVNTWGFNLPLNIDQMRYWGEKNRIAPYDLGAFRNYEHMWRCYSIHDPTISGNLAYYGYGDLVINLKYFPSLSTATSGVNHVFDVYFNRTNDFTHATHTQLHNDVIIADNGTLSIPIYPANPPDGGAALTANTSVYFKIKHVSSPDRRWDKTMFIPSGVILLDVEDDSFVVKVDIGQDVYNYYSDFYKESETSPIVYKYAGSGQMIAYVTVRNGNNISVNANLSFEINSQSDFNGTLSEIASGTFTIPAATRSGGTLVYGTVNVAISLVDPFSQWNIGQAYYGRVKMNSVTNGTFLTSYGTGYNGTILSSPPM